MIDEKTKEFDLYFNDLKENVQEEMLKHFNVSSPEEMNWDAYPLTTIVHTLEE